ncbi:hypothetical protein [Sulfitobacter donghicola]|uniref:YcxB-like protein domain-containing protein n=1 Tax=Sulfitobacter donghicola DSW-25 = KCTC 12864 = JCM 14565 TaxID=1300350 RepID=A0A073IEU3_9RHOB|nr:hypothetical protein [Sulfitobacter donghicola]KEJ88888.1 hypothetical protein DSW25_14005 [Sulfitobacter donghicola DSW-25 = KCTC 12864 = JCM 14565]KIN68546.1 hypothetical protein Z948_2277 [Sulfitobacter donghicola DSW-25 = KCTC 12864 = JCM 14565]
MSSDALAAWAPKLRVFLRRSLIVGLITLVVVALVGWAIGAATGFWQAMYVGPVLAVAYNMAFEDPARWRAARENRWYLRSDALIHHGPEGEARIPLADIADVRKRLGWTVVVFLTNSLRLRIAYVEDPTTIAEQILSARSRLKP